MKIWFFLFLLLAVPMPAHAYTACKGEALSLECFLPFYLSEVQPALLNPELYPLPRQVSVQPDQHNIFVLSLVEAYRALGKYDEAKKFYPQILAEPGNRTIEYLIHQKRYDEALSLFDKKSNQTLDKCTAALQGFGYYSQFKHVTSLQQNTGCVYHVGLAVQAACHWFPRDKLSSVIRVATEVIDSKIEDEVEREKVLSWLHDCYKTLIWLNQSRDKLAPVDFPWRYTISDFFSEKRPPPLRPVSEAVRAPTKKICEDGISERELRTYRTKKRISIGDKDLQKVVDCTVQNGTYSEFIKLRHFANNYDLAIAVVHAFRNAIMKGHYDIRYIAPVFEHLRSNTAVAEQRDAFENAVFVSVGNYTAESLQRMYWPQKTPAVEAESLARELEKYRDIFNSEFHLGRFDQVIFWVYSQADMHTAAYDFAQKHPKLIAMPMIKIQLAEWGLVPAKTVAAGIQEQQDLNETVFKLLSNCNARDDSCETKLPLALEIAEHIKDTGMRLFAYSYILNTLTHIHSPFHVNFYRGFNESYVPEIEFER